MKRSALALLALLVVTVPAAAQNNGARPARNPVRTAQPATQPARVHAADASDVPLQTNPTPPTPPTTPSAICCCRVWSHGWQYSWRPNAECTSQSGTCVTPDHC